MKNELIYRKSGVLTKTMLICSITVFLISMTGTSLFASAADTTGGWVQLFNGKDLSGFKHVGPGSHYVEDGLIKSKGGRGLLYWTSSTCRNCTIRVVFRMR
jgi:hypothetical protein